MPFLAATPFPFITTRVGSRTGLGYYQLRSVPVVGLPTVLSTKAKLVSYSQLVDADFRLAPWIGLTVGISLGNAVGVNGSGAFNLGINYAFGGALGLIFRLAQGEKWYLSARVDGNFNYAGAVLPAALTSSGMVENGHITFQLSSLTQTGSIIQGLGALMMAYSPHRMIGLQSSVGFNTNRVDTGSGNNGRVDHVQVGLGSSLRFDSKGVPLAILLGGNIQIETDRSNRVFFSTLNTQGTLLGTIEPGIFYSNPKYVDVGLSMSFQLGQNVRRNQAAIVLNHFW